jgi:hypothetical protein
MEKLQKLFGSQPRKYQALDPADDEVLLEVGHRPTKELTTGPSFSPKLFVALAAANIVVLIVLLWGWLVGNSPACVNSQLHDTEFGMLRNSP